MSLYATNKFYVMRALFVVMALFLATQVASAKDWVAQEYPIADVKEVFVGGEAQLELSQGDDEYLRVEASAEVMARVKVDLEDGKLKLSLKRKDGWFSWLGSGNGEVHFILRVKDLRYLEVFGAAKAQVAALDLNELKVAASGASHVGMRGIKADEMHMELSGASHGLIEQMDVKKQKVEVSGASSLKVSSPSTVDVINLDVSGASSFDGQALSARAVQADASGASHINISVIDQIQAEASGASSVDYYGAPKADTKSSGAGRVNAHAK